ncbi:uncharacterized protein [Asterias amurensis]|uniref:uncharacterized protein isoform X1 n=2 Tax=Asterias amurensis TaxID=7602 RepID=UPI003AB478D0
MMDKSDDKVVSGLREDVENLLQAFLHRQTVRYQIFAEEWRNFNFSFIHYAIEKRQEKKETMFEAFRVATDYLLPPYELQYRVGALYILYAMFETQPHKPKYKIRMGLEHWRSLKQLMDTLESQGHLDAVYIFNQLKMKKAFMFTAMPKKMIFHSSYMELKPEQNQTDRWLDRHRHSLMTESFDDTTLEVNHDLHKQYQKKKHDLGLHDNTSLMLVKESITEFIVKRFAKLEASLEASKESSQTTESSDSDEKDHGSRVLQIKQRSYTTVAKASKSRRHRQQAAKSHPSETPTKSKSNKSHAKKGVGLRKYAVKDTAIELSEDSADSLWTPSSSKKRKATPKVVKAPSVWEKKPGYSAPTEEEMPSEQTTHLEVTEEAMEGDLFYLPSTSKEMLDQPEQEIAAQHEDSDFVNSDNDDTEATATRKEPSLSPTPKKASTKNSNSSEPREVSNLRRGRSRKDSASVSPKKTTKAAAQRKRKVCEKYKVEESESKTKESKRERPSRRQTRNPSPETTPTKTMADKKETSKQGKPSQRQTRNSSLEITPTETKDIKKDRTKQGQTSQRQTRLSSPEITPTKTKDDNQEKSKQGRPRKETLVVGSNRSPKDTTKKKQKTSDENNARGSESSTGLEVSDVAARGRRTNVKTRGGKTGARTRGAKRR